MGIVEQLRKVLVTDELDLSELDESYVEVDEEGNEHPIKLPFRLNWTRGLKERRHDLRKELFAIQDALRDADDDEIEALNKRADAYADKAMAWWADVLLMDVDEVRAIQGAIPDGHWQWIAGQIVRRVGEYEEDAVKKAHAAPSPTSGEQGQGRQTSSSEPNSQE